MQYYPQYYPGQGNTEQQIDQQIQRLQSMKQEYQLQRERFYNPTQAQQVNVQSASPTQPKCLQVSSIDEVKGYLADPMGGLVVFLDTGNKHIHTKQVNLNGIAEIKSYILDDTPKESQSTMYAEKTEIETLRDQMMTMFQQLSYLKEEVEHARSAEHKQPVSGNNAINANDEAIAKPRSTSTSNDGAKPSIPKSNPDVAGKKPTGDGTSSS